MKKAKPGYSLLGNIGFVLSLLMRDNPADTLCMLLTPLTLSLIHICLGWPLGR